MRYCITGIILEINDEIIIIKNGHVGEQFKLIIEKNVALNYQINDEITLYIYDFQSQFEITSFTFNSSVIRNIFELLINIKSIGILTAKSIINSIEIDKFLNIIKTHNFDELLKYKFINKSSVIVIIKELNIKLFCKKYKKKQEEIIETLQKLGFSKNSIYRVIDQLDSNLPFENLIEQTLKGLSNNETD
ncbi:RuvA C-terminal domain-containing protein [Spiroplasma endosymbiont of Labia minor]|uniref:RuvA C-terminal domain-containing protein n=1 Tax=Spiroplasma endosymbiont of Labia minor TaxID=3066305 RepID=UPI0030D41CA8